MRKGLSKQFIRIPNVYSLHSLYMLRKNKGGILVGVEFLSILVKYVLYVIHSNLGSSAASQSFELDSNRPCFACHWFLTIS